MWTRPQLGLLQMRERENEQNPVPEYQTLSSIFKSSKDLSDNEIGTDGLDKLFQARIFALQSGQKEQTMKKIEKAWKSCICSSAPAGTQRSSGAMCGLEGLQEFRRRDFQANEAAVDRSWWWSLKNSLLQKFCFHTICLYSGGWPFQGLLCGYTRRVSLHAARGTPWLLYCAFSFWHNSIIRHSQCMASTSPTTMRGTRCKDGSCNC